MMSDSCADAQRAGKHNVQTTAAGRLLIHAIQKLGSQPIANALRISVDDVTRLTASEKPMSLAQQRVLAIAVLAIAEQNDLRREAARLLDQVRAAQDYHAGVTERHQTPPARWSGWR